MPKRRKFSRAEWEEWRGYIEALEDELPPPDGRRVYVRRAHGGGDFGKSWGDKKGWHITIDYREDFSHAIMILEHEWAHVLNGCCGNSKDIHGGYWPDAYAAVQGVTAAHYLAIREEE